jgi:hypothetical protein
MTAPNLQALPWIVDEQVDRQDSVERSYVLTPQWVYRRELDRSQEHPRPRYFRADPQAVLANEHCWGDLDPATWTPVDETGVPLP